jgi:hypothetical protein
VWLGKQLGELSLRVVGIIEVHDVSGELVHVKRLPKEMQYKSEAGMQKKLLKNSKNSYCGNPAPDSSLAAVLAAARLAAHQPKPSTPAIQIT